MSTRKLLVVAAICAAATLPVRHLIGVEPPVYQVKGPASPPTP